MPAGASVPGAPKSASLASKWTPTLKGMEKVQIVAWAVPAITAASKIAPQILWMLLKVVMVPAAESSR